MKHFFGEFIGTFLLVLIGTGSVAFTTLIAPLTRIEIALIWGFAVTMAIWVARPFSMAHLNPAVSIGFCLNKDLEKKWLPHYLLGQFAGAFAAALVNYFIFKSHITERSINTAIMFGEYFSKTEGILFSSWPLSEAVIVEFTGTFFLMFGILLFVKKNRWFPVLVNPMLIGVLLTVLIFLLAPFTQAGFNPARDLSPRLFSYLTGWKMAFSHNGAGWLLVYVVAPALGAACASKTVSNILAKKRNAQTG